VNNEILWVQKSAKTLEIQVNENQNFVNEV